MTRFCSLLFPKDELGSISSQASEMIFLIDVTFSGFFCKSKAISADLLDPNPAFEAPVMFARVPLT